MRAVFASVLAMSLAFSSVLAPAAMAQEPFRAAAPQAFSAEDLQRYGLSADDAAQVSDLQRQGYSVRVLSAEEAEQYSAGMSNRTWWIIGAVVVIAAIVAVSED